PPFSTLSLHDALPILRGAAQPAFLQRSLDLDRADDTLAGELLASFGGERRIALQRGNRLHQARQDRRAIAGGRANQQRTLARIGDRKSTRLNSSHDQI